LSACATATAQTPPAGYQGPNLEEQRAAMDRLAPLVGRWQGEANVLAPHAMTVHQTELVERDLAGLLIVIHGTGYATADHAGEPVFQAIAVASYDDRRDIYEFRSYTRGYATTATGTFHEDGAFVWQIDGGPVLTRFTIRFDDESWTEIGEMSRDRGATWTRTIEMNLTRAP
jgi:hypothetical protein